MNLFPFNLRMGGGGNQDKANVQYDGKRRAIPTTATSSYARLKDTGKSPKDDAVVYSGQMLDFPGVSEYVAIGDIS